MLLAKHFVPMERDLWMTENYEPLLKARRTLILQSLSTTVTSTQVRTVTETRSQEPVSILALAAELVPFFAVATYTIWKKQDKSTTTPVRATPLASPSCGTLMSLLWTTNKRLNAPAVSPQG